MAIFNDPPGLGGSSNSSLRSYPDPFSTYATLIAPRSMDDVLRWSEFLWNRMGIYSEVGRRVSRYFVTKLKITDCSDDEVEKWTKFLEKTMKLIHEVPFAGDDLLAYGNGFISIISPFRRYLDCQGCKTRRPVSKLNYNFKGFKFHFKCPTCGTSNTCTKPIDLPSLDESKVKLKRWNVHEIRLRQHPISQRYEYFWKPPADVMTLIREGDPFYLEDFPWEMIEAVRDKKAFKFADGVIFHMKEETLSGINTRGWGLPRFLTNFSNAFYYLMVRLYNEVLAAEYIVPTRVVSPSAGNSGTGDPMLGINFGDFSSQILEMLDEARRNPGGYYALPFPVEYQALSGEGIQFSTDELLNQAMDTMLNAAGFPSEMYKGTLQLQSAPMALRLFEQTWPHLVTGYNSLLQWAVDTIAKIFNWEKCSACFEETTFIDDVETKQLLFQLAASKQIPMGTALETLGMNGRENIKKLFNEQRQQQEEQEKFEREQEHRKSVVDQAGGGQDQGQSQDPMLSQMGDLSNASVGDMTNKAEQLATQLLNLPEGQRRGPMINLKHMNEAMHSLVKAKMESMRSQARSVGGPQALQQMVQQAAGQAGGQPGGQGGGGQTPPQN